MKLARPLAGVVLAAAVLLGTASPAAAHASFESSTPGDGDLIDGSVEEVTLAFSGAVQPAGDGFQVLDATGAVRNASAASTTDGSTWVLQFDPPLPAGEVGVRWMVQAPDAHPIEGSFSFVAGAAKPPATTPDNGDPSSGSALSAPQPSAPATSSLDDFLSIDSTPTNAAQVAALGRAFGIGAILLGVGSLVFAAVVLRGEPRDIRWVLFWARRSGVVVATAAIVEFAAQVALEAGGDWFALVDPGAVTATASGTFGIAILLRVSGGVGLMMGANLTVVAADSAPDPVLVARELVGAGMGRLTHAAGPGVDLDAPVGSLGALEVHADPEDAAWQVSSASAGAVAGALALIVSFAFDGHTISKGEWLLMATMDMVHVAAAAIWAGGVAMLAAVLWRRQRDGRPGRALPLAIRFSVVATVVLVPVGLAGLVMTVAILDSPGELVSTAWGRLLMLKIVLVGLAAMAGAYNHKVLVPELVRRPDDPATLAYFRQIVTTEAAILLSVGLVTAWLVGAAS